MTRSRLTFLRVFPAVLALLTWGLAPAEAQSVNARNQIKIARSHAEQGDWDKAREYAERVLQEEPGYLDALFLRAYAFRETGEHEKAAKDFREVIRIDPKYLPTYGALGETLLRAEKYDEAEKVFLALSDQPGGAVWASYYRGVVAYRQGELTKAESFWKEAVEVDTLFVMAIHNLGALYLAQMEYPKAMVQLREAVDREPDRARYRFHLAYAQEKTGQVEAARQGLRTLLSDYADDQKYWLLARGYNQLLAGETEPAGRVLKTITEDYPDSVEGWLLKARVHLVRQEWPDAVEAVTKGGELDPSFLEFEELWQKIPGEHRNPGAPGLK